MLNIMVIGADHLGNIEKNLATYGAAKISHVSGRATLDQKIAIPQTAGLVVILTDCVNHGTARRAKAVAKAQGIPAIFSKRSWCWLEKKLLESGFERQKSEFL
ncbi:DUF2325 domain-containing protein [Propionispira raffinosivorans]|uniref:DUF2325 domain-containing protein n=1 Tax=Propionispira raffinosivorans TaxID=86959 RepID=UPI00036A0768|nr:DUF2325 domain-containing protein [Propionispira raffinosivorans]